MKSCFLEKKKYDAYQCFIQNLLIFKLISYQFLFGYSCCYCFSTGKLGNPQEQNFFHFFQTHAKIKKLTERVFEFVINFNCR